jgi:hypothetical protein
MTAHREEDFTLSNGEGAHLKFVKMKNKYASHKYNRSGVVNRALLGRQSQLLAQSGHSHCAKRRPLSGVTHWPKSQTYRRLISPGLSKIRKAWRPTVISWNVG